MDSFNVLIAAKNGVYLFGRLEFMEYNVWQLLEIHAQNIVEKLFLNPLFHHSSIPLFQTAWLQR